MIPRAFWSAAPLRQVIATISRSQRIAVLLDRRVDPDQTIDLAQSNVTAEQLLRHIAQDRGLGMTLLGPVVYLGPAEAALRLRTIALMRQEEARDLPGNSAMIFQRAEPLVWDDFATPRQILSRLATSAGIEISGLEQIPHDLWAGASLPPLTLVERLTLIAIQFDLTFRIGADGRSVVLVPVPPDVAIERRYPGGADPQRLAAQWSELLPGREIRVVGHEILVRGLVEDHERIGAVPKRVERHSPQRGSPGRSLTRFTVSHAQGPLDQLLDELARKLQLEVEIDREALRAAGISPTQVVSFHVENATLEELFEAVLAPAGCTFRRKGNRIEVIPAR